MDQNQTLDSQAMDNDLQKAIDDITNSTNVDPVFSDPVAAPSSVPEGDTGELSEPVGPFPEPTPESIPEPTPAPEVAPTPEPTLPPAPDLPTMPDLSQIPTPTPTPPETAPEPEPTQEPAPEPTLEKLDLEPIPGAPNIGDVKKAALRDLIPILNKANMTASEKFHIYRDIFDTLKDYTVIEPAYQTARSITDETERAEALLYLVQAIDKM